MSSEVLAIVAVAAIVNYFTRVFPFLFFIKKEPPPFVLYIEKYFPAVIMVILVFYTIKDIELTLEFSSYKEIFSVLVTATIHILFKNFLISIFTGTLFYMVWVQYL